MPDGGISLIRGMGWLAYIVKASHGGVDTVRGLFVIMLCSGFEAGEECEFGVEGDDGVEDAGE